LRRPVRGGEVARVLLVVKNDCVNVGGDCGHLVLDGLKHHLERLGVAIDRGDHRERVRANLEVSRRTGARQSLVGQKRGVKTTAVRIHRNHGSQILLPGFCNGG
jgi:hypothetical protein